MTNETEKMKGSEKIQRVILLVIDSLGLGEMPDVPRVRPQDRGADTLGNVVRAAGAAYCMDEVEIVRNIEDAGYVPKRRNMHYEILGEPIFRERPIPRLVHLATARADGDTSIPVELVNYAARSRAERERRART